MWLWMYVSSLARVRVSVYKYAGVRSRTYRRQRKIDREREREKEEESRARDCVSRRRRAVSSFGSFASLPLPLSRALIPHRYDIAETIRVCFSPSGRCCCCCCCWCSSTRRQLRTLSISFSYLLLGARQWTTTIFFSRSFSLFLASTRGLARMYAYILRLFVCVSVYVRLCTALCVGVHIGVAA